MRDQLIALARYLTKPVYPKERSIGKNDRFAIVPVECLHNARAIIEGTDTSFECLHTPRVEAPPDSHGSIYPSPGVDKWPLPNGGSPDAYQLAVQTYLAEQALRDTHKIRDLAGQ